MQHPDAYCAASFDDYSYDKNMRLHTARLSTPRAVTDVSAPQSTSFYPKERGSYQQREQTKKVIYENKLLLSKMAKIFTEGAHSTGGPPSRTPRKPSTARSCGERQRTQRPEDYKPGSNKPRRKKEIEKIIRDNDALLGRITSARSHYSVESHLQSDRERQQRLQRLTRFGKRNPRPKPLVPAPPKQKRKPAISSKIDPVALLLSGIDELELTKLLSRNVVQGCVKRVFVALMLLVSPFEASELDISWRAVQQWVQQLGGADRWLSNLKNFKMSLVPVSNAVKALGCLDSDCAAPSIESELGESLALRPAITLLKWVREQSERAIRNPDTHRGARKYQERVEQQLELDDISPRSSTSSLGSPGVGKGWAAHEYTGRDAVEALFRRRFAHVIECTRIAEHESGINLADHLSKLCLFWRRFEVAEADNTGRLSEPFVALPLALTMLGFPHVKEEDALLEDESHIGWWLGEYWCNVLSSSGSGVHGIPGAAEVEAKAKQLSMEASHEDPYSYLIQQCGILARSLMPEDHGLHTWDKFRHSLLEHLRTAQVGSYALEAVTEIADQLLPRLGSEFVHSSATEFLVTIAGAADSPKMRAQLSEPIWRAMQLDHGRCNSEGAISSVATSDLRPGTSGGLEERQTYTPSNNARPGTSRGPDQRLRRSK